MKALTLLCLLSLAATVQAGQQKITETETGITVEYTGSAPNGAGRGDQAAAAASSAASAARDAAAQLKGLRAKLEQLRNDGAALRQLTGKETPEELALKNVLAEENRVQSEACASEIRALVVASGPGQAAEAARPADEKQVRAPNYREEKKQQIRELKMLRLTGPPPGTTP
jgi:hypothetical protein